MRFPFELTGSRIIQGRKDPSKYYTIIEGMITLADNRRAFMEALLFDRRTYMPGQYGVEINLDTDRARRLTAFVKDLHPVQQQKAVA